MPEKVEYRTPEEKEACDYIRYKRRYHRIVESSYTLTHRIDEVNGKVISARVKIHINKRTGEIYSSSGLYFCGKDIHPTTNKKLNCTNQHALNELKKIKSRLLYLKNNRYAFDFCTPIENNISLREILYYYDGYIGVSSCFRGNNRCKIKYIDELEI